MFSLTEDRTKECLRAAGLPVPDGAACASAEATVAAVRDLGGSGVVKALVPTGRRGKAGAVKVVATADEAGQAAAAMLGAEVHGFPVEQVYVEQRVSIAEEYYLSLALDNYPPKILLSRHGGVDIEDTHRDDPDAVIRADIDVINGLSEDSAAALWRQAGLPDDAARRLGSLSADLYRAFVAADAVMLEINPLALDTDGNLVLVGAMMGIDESGLPRHAEWDEFADGSLITAWREYNARERSVAEANRKFKGGAVRYTELDGDIGLLVGGGGASLLVHDLMLAAGGRPANHTDTNPGAGSREKNKAAYRAIFTNPATNCLLIAANYLQLTDCGERTVPLLEVIDEDGIDPLAFPIILRVLGPGEKEARASVAGRPGITYLPPEASLDDAVRVAVETNRRIVEKKKAAAS